MQLSNIPGKLVLPFANAGGKNTIPVASQIGITAGAASLVDGFPPLTRTPIAAGGVPPSGLDMNGVLFELSAVVRWANAGGGYPFDGTFAADTNVGGYPKGARLLRADGLGYWFNTVENNIVDPETSGAVAAGWVPDFSTGVATVAMASANVTLTPAQYGKSIIVITGVLTANLNLIFPAIAGKWTLINSTTGNFSITAKTASGIGVAAVAIQDVVCDGVNVSGIGANAATVTFYQAGTGAIPTSLQAQLRKYADVFQFGALGNASADDTPGQQLAVNYVQSTYDPATYASASPANGPSSLFYPAGYYKTNGEITVTKKVAFKGDGPAEFSSGSRVVQFTTSADLFKIIPIAQGMSVSFEDMTMIGSATGAGHLIHVTKASSGCNSQRYRNLVFGTPPALAMNIEAGDDIIIDSCLFDVSANNATAFGTGAAANAVSNVRFDKPAFFAVNTTCVLLYNIDGMQIMGAQVYPSAPGNRTARFVDGYNTIPYQIKNVSIIGGNFKNVNSLVHATAVNNLKIADVDCSGFGAGTGATESGIELTGTNVGVTITGNTFSGGFDTKNFYNDSGGTVTQANISGNTFINTGGTGQALVCGNTSGVISNNTFIGFVSPSVSEKVYTTGNAVSPGVIASLSKYTATFTVGGAGQGDKVTVGIASLAWMCPIGIEIVGFISAGNTVSVEYRNVTAAPIGVGAHDISYCVTRGV